MLLNDVKQFRDDIAALPREQILEKIQEQDKHETREEGDPGLIQQIRRIEWVFANKLTHLHWNDGSPIQGRNLTNEELALILDPPFKPVQRLTDSGIDNDQQFHLHVCRDPVLWAKRILGTHPRVYQILMMRDPSSRRVFRIGRRAGKTHTLATLILHHSWTTTDGRTLVLAPMDAHVKLIFEEVMNLLEGSPQVAKAKTRDVRTPHAQIEFSTGSSVKFFTTGMKAGGKCLTPDHDILTRDGWKSIAKAETGEEVLSWDGQYYTWKTITNTWREHYSGTMRKVKTQTLSALTTENHQFPVLRDGQWQRVLAQDLKESDRVAVSATFDNRDPEALNELLQHVMSEDLPTREFYVDTLARSKADQLQAAALRCGRQARMRPTPQGWRVIIGDVKITTAPVGKVIRSFYNGPVFCIEVAETGNFVVRHNGNTFVSGNSDVARGQEAQFIVLDEMDYMGDDDLDAIYAMLQRTKANDPEKTLIGASTPTGKKKRFWEYCNDPRFSHFSEHYYPSYVNPFFDKEMEAEFRNIYSENAFRREIEADWGEDAEGVYPKRYLDQAFVKKGWKYSPVRHDDKNHYYIGVDWDKFNAGPNIVVVEKSHERFDDARVAGLLRISHREEIRKGQEFALTRAVERVIELNDILQPSRIMIDRGYGEQSFENLAQAGIDNPSSQLRERLTGVSFSEKIVMKDPFTRQDIKKDVKPYMVEILQRLLEGDQLFFPEHDEELYYQLLGYVVTKVSDNGRPIFDGTYGDHAHDALALACLGYAFDYDKLHAKPKIAKRAAMARLEAADTGGDEDDGGSRHIGAQAASYGQRRHRTGARRMRRKMF